jgi:hypothetical protein
MYIFLRYCPGREHFHIERDSLDNFPFCGRYRSGRLAATLLLNTMGEVGG